MGRKKDREEKEERRKISKKDFKDLLRETEGIDRHSHWSDIKKIIEKEDRYVAVDSSSQRQDWFDDYIQELKDEHRREKKKKKDKDKDKDKEKSKKEKKDKEEGEMSGDEDGEINSGSEKERRDSKEEEEVKNNGQEQEAAGAESGEENGVTDEMKAKEERIAASLVSL